MLLLARVSQGKGASAVGNAEFHESTLLMWRVWSKTDRKHPEKWHGLPWHCLEVGVTAQALWRLTVSPRRRARLARTLGVTEELLERWIGFLAAAHDFGKLTVLFESLAEVQWWRLEKEFGAALHFPTRNTWEPPHGLASTILLTPLFQSELGMEAKTAERYALITGSHHGIFPSKHLINEARFATFGEGAWQTARRQLFVWLRDAFQLPSPLPPALLTTIPSYPDAIWLTALISIADWLGSDSEIHPFHTDTADPAAAVEAVSKCVAMGLRESGWLLPPVPIKAETFQNAILTLPDGADPRPSQLLAVDLIREMSAPGIAVIEFPTGAGKTEVALWGAAWWAERFGIDGFYIAMPTMATSDQLHFRVSVHLSKHLNGRTELVNLQLVHGQAALSIQTEIENEEDRKLVKQIERLSQSGASDEDHVALIQRLTWFLARKRGLLARYGVGTVDQPLMGGLRTKHFFVRLFGVADKTVIFDEVHSYDVYMSTLFDELLRWIGALGAPVVILSATLPAQRTQEMLIAYADGAGWAVEPKPLARYPRISVCDNRGIHSETTPRDTDLERTISLHWMPMPVDDQSGMWRVLGEQLRNVLRDGGTAALICNTVQQSQDAYRALQTRFGDKELTLFHARFRQCDRAKIQDRVLSQFGKDVLNPKSSVSRPHRHLVVATQVIEQSLDLDFDLVVSLFCPTDLILQRAGRMQRHRALDAIRPARFRSHPQIWVTGYDVVDGVPAFLHGSTLIYSRYVLLRSWAALHDRVEIRIPDDVSDVVEATYDDREPPADLAKVWIAAREAFEQKKDEDQLNAGVVLVPSVHFDNLDDGDDALKSSSVDLTDPDDEPFLHANTIARTRLGPPSVRVVILTPDDALRLKSAISMDRAWPLQIDEIRELLWCAVPLNNHRLVAAARDACIPPIWKTSAYLKHCRLVELDETGRGSIGDVPLTLHPLLGVLIDRDDAKGEALA